MDTKTLCECVYAKEPRNKYSVMLKKNNKTFTYISMLVCNELTAEPGCQIIDSRPAMNEYPAHFLCTIHRTKLQLPRVQGNANILKVIHFHQAHRIVPLILRKRVLERSCPDSETLSFTS